MRTYAIEDNAQRQTRYVEAMLPHYIAAALWSSTNENGDPLDGTHGENDIAPDLMDDMIEDCSSFVVEAWAWLDPDNDILVPVDARWAMAPEQVGHDFWLTRNRHGAGFWDRGTGEVGEHLTRIAHVSGEVDLYVADGQVHV